jgi:hypothetical protein
MNLSLFPKYHAPYRTFLQRYIYSAALKGYGWPTAVKSKLPLCSATGIGNELKFLEF